MNRFSHSSQIFNSFSDIANHLRPDRSRSFEAGDAILSLNYELPTLITSLILKSQRCLAIKVLLPSEIYNLDCPKLKISGIPAFRDIRSEGYILNIINVGSAR